MQNFYGNRDLMLSKHHSILSLRPNSYVEHFTATPKQHNLTYDQFLLHFREHLKTRRQYFNDLLFIIEISPETNMFHAHGIAYLKKKWSIVNKDMQGPFISFLCKTRSLYGWVKYILKGCPAEYFECHSRPFRFGPSGYFKWYSADDMRHAGDWIIPKCNYPFQCNCVNCD